MRRTFFSILLSVSFSLFSIYASAEQTQLVCKVEFVDDPNDFDTLTFKWDAEKRVFDDKRNGETYDEGPLRISDTTISWDYRNKRNDMWTVSISRIDWAYTRSKNGAVRYKGKCQTQEVSTFRLDAKTEEQISARLDEYRRACDSKCANSWGACVKSSSMESCDTSKDRCASFCNSNEYDLYLQAKQGRLDLASLDMIVRREKGEEIVAEGAKQAAQDARDRQFTQTVLRGVATLATTAAQGQPRAAATKQGSILTPAGTGSPETPGQIPDAIRQNDTSQQQQAGSNQRGLSAAPAELVRDAGSTGRLTQYTGPSLDSCVQGFFDRAHQNKFAFRNTCGQTLYVNYHARNQVGRGYPGATNLAPGEIHYTGDIGPSDLNGFGGYEVAACPFGTGLHYEIVIPDSSNSRGYRYPWVGGQYACVIQSTTK